MKNRLHILLAIAMCLLMFCAACGKDTTADNNNTDTPPDIGGDSTPDNTPVTDKDTTPPDDSADEDNYPTKTVTPYTIELPQYPDELTKLNNRQALDAYSDYLQSSGDTTAFDLKTQTEMKLSILNGYVGATYFQLVDFGYDGRLELVLCSDHSSNSYGIVFYEDGRLYVARIKPRNMMYLKYNGLCRSMDDSGGESYVVYNFSANDGVIIQTLATLRKDADSGEESYFVSADFIDGRFEETETFKVSKEDYETFVKPIKGLTSVSKKTRTTVNMNDAFTVKVQAIPNPIINRDPAFAKKEPTDDEKLANRDALRLYSRFLGDTWYAIELETGEKGSFYELDRLNNSYIDYTALVDFGLDGVYEMVIVPKASTEPASVVFYEDGEIYITYFDCNELKLLTYDGLCKNSSGGVDRLTFSAQNGYVRQSVISVATDSANKTTYYSHADSREITQAEYDGFMTEQTYPVYYDNESRYNMFSVIKAAEALPDEATIDANREVLQIYYDYINGVGTALDKSAGELVVFDDLIRQNRNGMKLFTLVDFGSDGVLEIMMEDVRNHYYPVLYYQDGQLYTSSVTHRGVGDLTYTGATYGSGGTSGSYYVLSFTENGREEWTISSHGLDLDTYETRYYLYAAYENGKLVPAEKVEVDKYTYYNFLENEPRARWYSFNDENLKKYLKIDSVTPVVQPDGGNGEAQLEVIAGGRVITEEYAIRLIEELEEWCNCAPFYTFAFTDAAELSSETLLRAYRVLAGAEDTYVLGYDDITAVLDRYFRGYSFSIDECSGSLEAGAALVPNGWRDFNIDITEMSGEGNTLRFTATLKKGLVKAYVIELYEDGYYILSACELESPDTAEQNAQAVQAYYEWLTGARGAMSKSNHNNITYHSTASQYSRFAFADFGSDGVLELLLGFDTSDTYHIVLYYDNGNLYIDSLDCEWLKANGYYEYDDTYLGRLTDHYIARYAPSKGEYTLLVGTETPPSKDTENPIYRLYFENKNGEYVQYMGEMSKEALYDQLIPLFSAPDVKWLSFDTVFEHEFFAGVTGNN